MCGICGVGFRDVERLADLSSLDRMTDALGHRGPDGRGVHVTPGAGLGVRRLSVIDLEHGDQPLGSEDGRLTLVANAEIYNHVELRARLAASGHRFRSGSDAEVILHLYEEEGPEAVRRLRGMFAFALWDAGRRQLLLARDRLGVKPLHIAIRPDGIWFASEMKSIFAAGAVPPAIDTRALRDLAAMGFVTGARTLFEGIERLPPGCLLLYRDGHADVRRYWSVSFPRRGEHDGTRSEAAWADALAEKLDETVGLHLRSDVEVGAWLSAGIDSSMIAALAARRRPAARLRTFSLDFEEPSLDEVRRHATLDSYPGYALANERVLCRASDFDAFDRALWHCEEPSLLEIPRWRLAGATARAVKVALTGEGADEVLGGYPWFRRDRALRPLARWPRVLRRAAVRACGLDLRRPAASRLLLAGPRMDLDRYHAMIGIAADAPLVLAPAWRGPAADAWPVPADFERWDDINQLRYFELTLRLPELVNHSLDRLTMGRSLEARVPFLDHELVEFCAAIPPRLLMRGFREKHILREAARGILPPAIVDRRKYGLRSAYWRWLRGDLPPWARELLSAECIAARGWFDAAEVTRRFERHRAGLANHVEELMLVLSVQLLDEMFIRGRHVPAPAAP